MVVVPRQAVSDQPTGVRVEPAVRGSLVEFISAAGEIQPAPASRSAPVSSARIAELPVQGGRRRHQGQSRRQAARSAVRPRQARLQGPRSPAQVRRSPPRGREGVPQVSRTRVSVQQAADRRAQGHAGRTTAASSNERPSSSRTRTSASPRSTSSRPRSTSRRRQHPRRRRLPQGRGGGARRPPAQHRGRRGRDRQGPGQPQLRDHHSRPSTASSPASTPRSARSS